MKEPAVDPIIDAERAHLGESRAALDTMRDRTERLISSGAVGGDTVSTAYLHQALWHRMRTLEADPDTPLFFGRLEYQKRLGAELDETLYIGRRHVTGESGDEPLVIDWRAPMSLPFYRARPGASMSVAMRRRFGFRAGQLTAYEDENLAGDVAPAQTRGLASQLLQDEIERPRTGPMRDIVATIQPEQDVLVRADLATSLCIQGAPGTGKTAVGLHRAAFLLYAFRARLSRLGVLVIGPNDSFLSYIGDVLPALGEIEASQHTVESLLVEATGFAARATDSTETALIKANPVMAQVIERAVWSHLVQPTENLVYPKGSRQFRVPAYRISELIDELRERGVRYESGRQLLARRLAHEILIKMEASGDSPDDRVHASVARSRPVKTCVNAVWPEITAAKLILALLTDEDLLARSSGDMLTADEQRLLIMDKAPRTPKAAKWSTADLALIDEAADRLERTGSVGHVIVDEAQDLSAMQLRAVGRRASTGSVTVLGDLAQATTPWASRAWSEALGHLGQPDSEIEELVAGFRVPGAVIDFAARLLPSIAPGLTPPHSIRRAAGELIIETGSVEEIERAAGIALKSEGNVAIILADAAVAELAAKLVLPHGILGVHQSRNQDGDATAEDFAQERLQLVPASLAKGLEFDHVVLADLEAIISGEPDRVTGLRRLYVCLTRAVSTLTIVHNRPIPAELD